ncbi:lipoprotein insertase outer membrane protein LolB [Actimicrobium antarcticum]|uniref:Outer-membrane lipoprotein LolB n=1 Tax=Actimicrobium antarcticum TaxID=1051899 RepID=A0ABP7T950_9BURK
MAGLARVACTAILVGSALTSCASLAPPPSLPSPATTVRPVTSIELGGRLSVRYQNNGKEEAVHGSFSWSQRAGNTLVTLRSPLGQTLATITIGPAESTLSQAGQPTRTAADPDALATEALGWPLPLAGLRDWLQGQATNVAGERVTASSTSTTPIVTNDGWQLQYVSWEASDPALPARPKRIDLSRTTPQAGDVGLRIVIDSWQPG